MYGRANMVVMRGFRMDPSITNQKLKPGTIRRIAAYARPYRMHLAVFLLATAVDAVITVVNPLLLRDIIDHGILGRDEQLVVLLACAVAVVAIFDAALGFVIRWFSARIGEGLIYDLRTQVFDHVQRQPIAFFTRAQTGSLVSRLDGDVVGAQHAITSTLSGVLSNLLSLVVILLALFYLSWQVSVIALLASVVSAVGYGLGGSPGIHGTFQIGTLVALTTLLARVYGPITSLSSVQVNVMTALVSFGRVFEVLDLKPLIAEKPDAATLPRGTSTGAGASGPDALAPEIEFADVSFR